MADANRSPSRFQIGDLILDTGTHTLTRNGDEIKLTRLPFALFATLVRHAPNLVTQDELLAEVWGDVVVSDEALKQRIKVLREAIGDVSDTPRYVASVRGLGYRLIAPVKVLSGEGPLDAGGTRETALSIHRISFVKELLRRDNYRAAIFAVVLLIAATAALSYLIYPRTVTQTAEESQVAISEIPENSIAVLPFADLSPEGDQEYFSDGISEEILNVLAQIPDLHVISRTSAFSFKGKSMHIPTVAKQLGVTHVLEGSVRKSGNRIRINAQLINATTDRHLWSQSYDRELESIFVIQDEIASEVVARLRVTLLGKEPKATETNPESYALYLQARHLNGQNNAMANQQAEALLQQALAIDPDYAPAWVELGSVYRSRGDLEVPSTNAINSALEAIDNALEIDPNFAPAHALLGRIVLGNVDDTNAAAGHLARALQLEPRNTDIVRSAAGLMHILGRLDQANALAEFVATHDPVNPAAHSALGWAHYVAGRWDEAIASFSTVLKLSPGHNNAKYSTGKALLFKGEPQAALEFMRSEDCLVCMAGLPIVYHALGRSRESDAALAVLIAQYEQVAAYNIAYVLAYRGEADRAFEWLDKAVQYKDVGLALITNEHLFFNLHDDPRWLPFLERIGMSPQQLAAIQFEFTLPE